MKLHPYQELGSNWLSKKRWAILADEMGLGKTVQAISAMDPEWRICVVCPAVAKLNWRNEFEKFDAHKRDIRIIGDTKTLQKPPGEKTVTITSYECVGSVLNSLSDSYKFDLVVIDEAHFVKSIETKRTKAILGRSGLIRFTQRMWLLTGTPCPNNASEVWTALYTFGATKLPFDQFVKTYCDTVETGFGTKIIGSKTDQKSLESFQGLIEPILLRRTMEEVGEQLPDIQVSTVVVQPCEVKIKEHRDLFKYFIPVNRVDDLKKELEEQYGLVNSIMKDNKMSHELLEVLKRESNSLMTWRRYNGLQKLDAVAQMVREELNADPKLKIVIFGLHRSCLEGLRLKLSEFKPCVVWGGSDQFKVEKYIESFQAAFHPTRVFIGQIKAAGTAITLTASNQVIFIERDWTPGNNEQAAARCRRIGQKKKTVFVRNIILDDPIERRIDELLNQKSTEVKKLFKKKPKSVEELL